MTTPKKVTATELKTFIDAVEFAADTEETWVPSTRQWIRIRDMINNLEETAQVVTTVPVPVHQPMIMPIPQPHHGMANIPMGMEGPPMPAGPSAFGGAQQMPQQMNHRAPLAQNAAMPVRTPDIDTSGGNGYTSSFA